MKFLREISRIIFIIGIGFGVYPGVLWKSIEFSAIFLFGIYFYPNFVIFIAKLLKAKPSMIGYQGQILIEPDTNEEGKQNVTFKSDIPIEDIVEYYEEVTFLVKKVND